MRRAGLFVALFLMGVSVGACGLIDPPVACYDNMDFSCDLLEGLPLSEGDDMVCNMVVTLEEACAEFIAILPPMVPIPPICEIIPPAVGTCQVIGAPGDPCAEGPDCSSGTCTAEVCG